MTNPNQSTDDTGITCKWSGTVNTSNVIYIDVLTPNKNGLSDIYTSQAGGKFAYFEPVTIDGYPGVHAEPKDSRSQGYCTLWLGVSDQLAVAVSAELVEGANQTQPCNSTDKVGSAVIEHLKGAA